MRLVLVVVIALVVAGCTAPADTPVEVASLDPEAPGADVAPTPVITEPSRAPEAEPTTGPPALPDPTLPGGLAVEKTYYAFDRILATDPEGAAYPLDVRGSLHTPEGAGPFPVVILLHGRHGTCDVTQAGEVLGTYVCPETPATTPVDSFEGYDYLAENLASHGFLVASIDANQINDLDIHMSDAGADERAQLVLATLDALATNEKADMGRIGLMGHSRGGEGVARAITRNAERSEPHAIEAVFALAPTDFDRHLVPGVAFATLLPYCDGDVSNLQGQRMFDDTRFVAGDDGTKSMLLFMGSNHNFYNTIWTGDDASWSDDPACGEKGDTRLSPEDQRRHGLAYMAAFFRLHLAGQDEFAPLFTGAASPPSPACPGAAPSCPGLLHVSWHAAAGDRLLVEDTLDPDTLTQNDLGGTNRFEGFDTAAHCFPALVAPRTTEVDSPIGPLVTRTGPRCPGRNYAAAPQLTLNWTQPAKATFETPDVDVRSFDVLSFRAGLNVGEGGERMSVTLVDAAGARATAQVGGEGSALFRPPGEGFAKTTPNEVRLPLGAFPGIDLGRVQEIVLAFDGSGSLQLTDLQFQREQAQG